MKMTFRWFPQGDDSVKLWQIRQIPGMTGVVACLPKVPAGEVWPVELIEAVKKEVNEAGLEMEVIESVNVHEDIKKGLPSRDKYIENYQETIRRIGAAGVKCLCYNFMPVMDWARSSVTFPLADGSTVLSYRHEEVLAMDPKRIAEEMVGKAHGYSQPGWEPERMAATTADIAFYNQMTTEEYWANMKYFLDAVVPVAAEAGVNMAIHPDDPPWPLYGLPKVITGAENIRKFLALHDSPANGLTLCTGSLGADQSNDIPALIREFTQAGRVHFAHVRNVKHHTPKDFDESAHLSACGDLDMVEVMRAFYESGFTGYMRPDHGRMIWGEQARPGYGLYDRALGACYLQGIWETLAHA